MGSGHRRQGTQQSLLSDCSHSLPQGEIGGGGLLSTEGLPVIRFPTPPTRKRDRPMGKSSRYFNRKVYNTGKHWAA